MKVAIIGGGFFGCATALEIKNKFKKSKIEIFDKKKDILFSASGKNQFRCHLGYHYPRSEETIRECQNSNISFKKYLKNSFIDTVNYYAISKKNSKTDFNQYLKILEKNDLKYEICSSKLLLPNTISGEIKVPEKIIDISIARKTLKESLFKNDILLKLKNKVDLNSNFLRKYDLVVLCSYDENNSNLKNLENIKKEKFFYQLVVKNIVKLPQIYKKKSVVVLDGDFMCLDPYGKSDFTLLGSVKKSVKLDKQDFSLGLKEYDKRYLNSPFFKNINYSNFKEIKKDFKSFFVNFDKVKYLKSFSIIRSTKKNLKDARLTSYKVKKNLIIVHSGKWINCFDLGKKIANKI